jgi:hypothetical protein
MRRAYAGAGPGVDTGGDVDQLAYGDGGAIGRPV